MTFTIPPFWCGVIATLAGELIAIIVAALIKSIKDKKNATLRRK